MGVEKGKMSKFLQINGRLEVRPYGDEGKYFKSLIMGVKGDLFLMNPPYRGRDDLLLYKGDKVETVLITDKEKYLFVAEVVERVNKPFEGYVLKAPEDAKRIQLRQFVRIKVALDIEWAIISNQVNLANKGEVQELAFAPGIMVDLSGGGAGFVADEEIPEDTQLLLHFKYAIKEVDKQMTILAEVKRCQKMDDRNKYIIGVAFLGLSDREQDDIIEYVFFKQREQLLLEDGVN